MNSNDWNEKLEKDLEDPRQVVGYLERVLSNYDTRPPSDPGIPEENLAKILCMLGAAYNRLGYLRQADHYFQRALAIYEHMHAPKPHYPDFALVLTGLGVVWADLGDTQKSVDYHERSLAMYEQVYNKDPNHPEAAKILRDLGFVCDNLGRYTQALEYLEKSLKIVQKRHKGKDHDEVVESLRAVGAAHENLGNYDQAIEHYQQIIQLRQKCHKEQDQNDLAEALESVGNVHYQLGRLEEAIQNYEQALAVPAASPAAKANIGRKLGCMYHVASLKARQAGDEPRAQVYLEKASAAFKEAYKANIEVDVELEAGYGNFLLATGQVAQAYNHLRQAIESQNIEPGLIYSLQEQQTVTPALQAYLSQQQEISLRGTDYAYYLVIHHYEGFQQAGVPMSQTREEYLKDYQTSLDHRSGRPRQSQEDKTAYHLLGTLYEAQGDHEAAAAAFARAQDGTEQKDT